YQLIFRSVLSSGLELGSETGAVDNWPVLWTDERTKQRLKRRLDRLPLSVQEEWIRRQGPYCTELLKFLQREQNNYSRFLFFTYLYPTTYFGSYEVPSDRRILIPTLHDEPPAYLPAFREMMRTFPHIIFLSAGEHNFADRLGAVSG